VQSVTAQEYPNRPIRIIASGPGGSNDFAARMVAQGLSASIGRQVIVENRPSGVIPGQTVSQAQADGYTLLISGDSLWILPLLQDVPFDAIKDFSPITLIDSSPNLVVIHPSVKASSVKELIALAKARPGLLNYGSATSGGQPHIAGELFKSMAGVNILRVAYKGMGPALNDLMGGQIEIMFPNFDLGAPHVHSGRLRALAITSARPSILAADLPTVSEAGLPGYEVVSRHAMMAPAKTPPAIINRLNNEVVAFLNTPAVKERFLKSGVEIVAGAPEQLSATIKSEVTRVGKVIKDAGIRAD
jgi:tripartite-type tricarboxylate transporter receptor subunit TctC